jgi:allantoin racemase
LEACQSINQAHRGAVLEGYGSAIEMAKLLVNLRHSASGLAFPSDRPRKWRRRKVF